MRTDEELKKIAQDLAGNLIFMSDQIRNQEDLPMVFMVIALADKESIDQMVKDGAYVFFEYTAKAMPRSINGYPCFLSASYLTVDEYKKVRELEAAIRKAIQDVTVPSSSG